MAKIVLPQKGLTQHNNLSKLTTFDSVFQLLHSALENNWDISFSINNVRTSDELLLHSLERLHCGNLPPVGGICVYTIDRYQLQIVVTKSH